MKPTIVLAHGAYAESSSWHGVVERLHAAGHRVVAAAVPLRTLAGDAEALTDVVRSVQGPVVLVAHSYGGAVMTNVPADAGEIVGLVYAAGFALAPGESAADASALAPGSTLGDTLVTVPLSVSGDKISGSTTVSQKEFGIKPFSAMMGALKVPDEVTVEFEGSL